MQPSYQMSGGMPGGPQQPMLGVPPNPYGAPKLKLTEEEKRKEKRRKEREMMIKRKEDERKKDSDATVMWMTFGSLFNGLFLIIPMLGSGWQYKRFTGVGLKMMHIATSLFQIDIKIECGKNWLEDKLCHAGDKMNGVHSLQKATHMACAISNHACNVMTTTYYSSFIIFIFFSFAIICNFLAAMFLHNYWWHSKLPKMKQVALFFFAAGPAFTVMGFAGWNVVAPDLAQLPHGLTQVTGALAGGGALGELFSYKVVASFPFGWAWMCAIVAILVQVFTFMCWPMYFMKSDDEEAALEAEELEQERAEAELLAQYDQQFYGGGAMMPGMYGAPPDQMPPGSMPYGVPPEQMPPGSMPYGVPPEQMPPGGMPYGGMPPQVGQQQWGGPPPPQQQEQNFGLAPPQQNAGF